MALVSYGNVMGVSDTTTSIMLSGLAGQPELANSIPKSNYVGPLVLTDYRFAANSTTPVVDALGTDPVTDGAILRNQQSTVVRKIEYWT